MTVPISVGQAIAIIATAAVCTFLTRVLPFALFGGKRKMPKAVAYLGTVLPPAIIATLVIFCLRSIHPLQVPSGIPEMIAVILVAVLHVWKRNTLLSIAGGTICYMLMVQVVFI